MPIPDFQTIMRPMLELASDGKEQALGDARQELARIFKLTEEELKALLPSGRQPTFTNRVALHGRRAKKGVFITTSSFSADAIDYVARIEPKVVLIDGRSLAGLMIDFNVGVSPVAVYETKKIDSDYFGEE